MFSALPTSLLNLLNWAEEQNLRLWLVGGCVRDELLGLNQQDYDLACAAPPDQLKNTLEESPFSFTSEGYAQGSLKVFVEEDCYEITSFRQEGRYLDGRHPEMIRFTPHLEEDLRRRDFTLNALAWRAEEGLQDPWGGLRDLEIKSLRCIGTPALRFQEDALRLLRALRLCLQIDGKMEAQTQEAWVQNLPLIHKISAERAWPEWKKILLLASEEQRKENEFLLLLCFCTWLQVSQPETCVEALRQMRAWKRWFALPPDPILRLSALTLLMKKIQGKESNDFSLGTVLSRFPLTRLERKAWKLYLQTEDCVPKLRGFYFIRKLEDKRVRKGIQPSELYKKNRSIILPFLLKRLREEKIVEHKNIRAWRAWKQPACAAWERQRSQMLAYYLNQKIPLEAKELDLKRSFWKSEVIQKTHSQIGWLQQKLLEEVWKGTCLNREEELKNRVDFYLKGREEEMEK